MSAMTRTRGGGPPEAQAFSAATREFLRRMASRYVWWKSPDEALEYPERVIAQVMNIGDWKDVVELADTVGEDGLRRVLREAEIGQFNARSWHYWHYRLGLAEYGLRPVPPMPVRRTR